MYREIEQERMKGGDKGPPHTMSVCDSKITNLMKTIVGSLARVCNFCDSRGLY